MLPDFVWINKIIFKRKSVSFNHFYTNFVCFKSFFMLAYPSYDIAVPQILKFLLLCLNMDPGADLMRIRIQNTET
jgi:hypothetical protein